jgi:hypothetical protein
MPSRLQLTTKTDATKIINTAKTLAETSITNASDVNALIKALRDQVPAKVIVAK